MALKVTYSWIIYSCLIFGSGILCDRKLEKRHAVSSGSEAIDDMFYCLNGLRIEWSSVCDNNRDCSDGSDETNEFCARYEYGRNISMDCGRVSKEIKNEHSLEATPWIVDIYATHKSKISQYLGLGSIISPNVVVTVARIFWSSGIRFSQNSKEEYDQYLCKIDIPLQNYNENDHNYIDAKIIYLYDGANYEDLAVIVLETKISFSNGVTPVCIDWNRRYNARLMRNYQLRAYGKISGFKIRDQINHTAYKFERFFAEIYTDLRTCEKNFDYCIWFKLGQREDDGFDFQSLSVLHSDLYYLTGVGSFKSHLDKNKLGFKAITYQIPWIRGILFKYTSANSCVLPAIEGVVHSYEGSQTILSPRTLIDPYTTVIENCEVGYHKARPNSFRICRRYGIWKTDSDKLCLKMCQPLLSDSLDIQCSYNGNYANCSNQSKPDTKAKLSCKLTHYFAPSVQEEAAKELHCQSNGMWDKELYRCNIMSNACVLPTVEGVVFTYEDSNDILSQGTLVNHGVTVNENCTFGYHNVNPNGFRVCQKNGKWKSAFNELCLKMCPPLVSDGLDIKCSYKGNYTDCSNLSIPDTIAIPSCKPTHYFSSNGQEETAKELHCQSHGMWDKELYRCNIISNACVLPTVEGVVFTYEDSNDILSQGTLVNHGVTVNENCTFGYHNVKPNGFRVCQKNGKWKSAFNKLCLKMCPPLLSDSLDIKCSYISKYTNCSNLSIPGTIATPKCKATYVLPNEHKETPLELHCQSNGLWDKELYRCNIISNACVLPTVEGVVFTYEDSNDILSQGTLVNHGVTVNENCTFGYYNVNPNGFRVCQKNGKWKSAFNELCLKMCTPLVSDSLDIKCSYKGNYTDCSNLSIPDTIAIPSCKPTHYFSSNGQEETAKELHCQSHGMWDKELYKCNILNTCVLPKVEGVVYTYEYSNESLSHGTIINHGVTVNENCTFGYHNVYPNSFRVCQINGKWKTAYDKLCLKMCPPQLSDSLDIKCTYNGKKTNCSNLSIPDTIAIPKCKDTYSLPNGKIETPIELHCQSNGLWDKELYICEPDCGRPFIKTQILINNGETANVGTAPWNVAIYKKKYNYEFKCGGSIISRNLVVSAAHCFWEKGMPYTIIIIDDLYKVAVGKYYKNFKIFDNEYPQIINVDRILMQDGYNGFFGHYAVDIAVVVLQNSVFFSNGITPVCMDWNGIYNVSNGDEGKIVGWGKTKEGIESPILLKTGLPYINLTTCRDMYTLEFQSYVTPDKCCAGFSLVPGYGVDEGDSGAGLCFSHFKLYYLTGVVSLREADANNSIALFTSVHYHIVWIRSLYIKYNTVQYN